MGQQLKSILLGIVFLHASHLLAGAAIFNFVKANDDIVSVNSNATSTSGDVSSNDTGGNLVKLNSSSVGNYGTLTLGSSGGFTYSLRTNSAALLALHEGQIVADVFPYTYQSSTTGFSSTAKLTIQIVGNPSAQDTTDPTNPTNPSSLKPIAYNDTDTFILGEDFPQTNLATMPAMKIDFLGNDINASSAQAYLVSNQVGNYGYIRLEGGFIYYSLDHTNPEVQTLSNGERLTDTFTYRLRATNQARQATDTEATVTVQIVSRLGAVFNDGNVEVEPNNTRATPTPLNHDQYMRGQLSSGEDRDWFSISTTGDEILHFELCPFGTSCYNQKGWVMYIFDADKLTDAMEYATVPLRAYHWKSGTITVESTYLENQMHLLYSEGKFDVLSNGLVTDSALVGIIDPCFGITNTLDIGKLGASPSAKHNYFVALSTPLERDGGAGTVGAGQCNKGSVILEKPYGKYDTGELTEAGRPIYEPGTLEYIALFPYSEDEYTFRYTRSNTSPLAPGTPNFVSATRAANASAAVTFTPPSSNGGSPITSYTVTSSDGKTVTGDKSPIIVSGLTTGKSYRFTVKAENEVGPGAASAASNSISPASVPGQPGIGIATYKGSGQASVTFTAPAANGGSPITSYTVTSNPGNKKTTGSKSPLTIRGLATGTHYSFTVTATNAIGTSEASAPVLLNDCSDPATITVPTSDADGKYEVSWTASEPTGAKYVVEESTSPTFTTSKKVYAVKANKVNSTRARATTNKTYYYRVKAWNTGFTDSGWRTADNGCEVPGTSAATAPKTTP